MDHYSATESRLLICHSLPASFPLPDLRRAGDPEIFVVPDLDCVAAAAEQAGAVALILIGMKSFSRAMDAACRSLRDNPATTRIPVCVVAEGEAGNSRLEVLETGVAEFLESPWDQQEVRLRLRKYLDENSWRCLHADSTLIGSSTQWGWQQELVWAAQQFLAVRRKRNPSHNVLARSMGVTAGRLESAFRHVLGISVYDYLRRQKMALAQELLRDTRLSMLHIAEVCGYTSPSNFTATFRRYTDMTPSVYRRHAPLDAGSAPDRFRAEQSALYRPDHGVGARACSEVDRCSVPLWRGGQTSVLVASDRPGDFEPALSQLRAHLFDVTTAGMGWDAYYQARTAVPCVLLVDAELGSMDSMTLCRLVQRAGMLSRTGVIVISRSKAVQTCIACLELGAFDVLSLPLDPKELMLRIAAHRRATLFRCEATADCGKRSPRSTTLSPIVQALMDLVERKGGLVGGVKTLAKLIGIRERRLAEMFKAEMGEPLSTYLRRQKIQAACRLLSDTTISIREIAIQVGFRSQCNFAVAFQRSMGMTPSRYRGQALMVVECDETLVAAGSLDDQAGGVGRPALPE